MLACGALGSEVRAAARRFARAVEVHTLPASLHNRPAAIAPAVEWLCRSLAEQGKDVVVAYADCGTYGALDEVCSRLGVRRLPGLHCYDLLAGDRAVAQLFAEEPGTYLVTDFLLRSFDRLVARGLGIDRRPELVAEYFSGYRRVVWLAERPDPVLARRAQDVADLLGLRLEVRIVGTRRLAGSLRRLIDDAAPEAAHARSGVRIRLGSPRAPQDPAVRCRSASTSAGSTTETSPTIA